MNRVAFITGAGGSARIAGKDANTANLVEFLASDKARFITGQTYVCDGGRGLSMKGID